MYRKLIQIALVMCIAFIACSAPVYAGNSTSAVQENNVAYSSVSTPTIDIFSSPVRRPVEPAFGPISFSSGLAENSIPLGVDRQFYEGLVRLYASFPYMGMLKGLPWRCEWLYEGQIYSEADIAWNEGEHGNSFCSTTTVDDTPLKTGVYQVNLFIGDRLMKSAQVPIVTVPKEEATSVKTRPEEMIDPVMLPAWNRLVICPDKYVQEIAERIVKYQIPVTLDSSLEKDVAAMYYCREDEEKMGEIHFSPDYIMETSVDEVASILVHELVHAYQSKELKQCGCAKYNEVVALTVQLYTLRVLNRTDIIKSKYRWAYDSQGEISNKYIWDHVNNDPVYENCQAYFGDPPAE